MSTDLTIARRFMFMKILSYGYSNFYPEVIASWEADIRSGKLLDFKQQLYY